MLSSLRDATHLIVSVEVQTVCRLPVGIQLSDSNRQEYLNSGHCKTGNSYRQRHVETQNFELGMREESFSGVLSLEIIFEFSVIVESTEHDSDAMNLLVTSAFNKALSNQTSDLMLSFPDITSTVTPQPTGVPKTASPRVVYTEGPSDLPPEWIAVPDFSAAGTAASAVGELLMIFVVFVLCLS